MKNTPSLVTGRWAGLLAASFVLVAHSVHACPGCKEVVVDGQATSSPMSLGFSYSIGFFFLTLVSIISSLVWMMVKSANAAWRPADENAYTAPRQQ